MSSITIFEEPSNVATVQRESRRMDRMSSGGSGSTMRRIQLSNGRTFKRVINGEQIGKAASDTLDVIIVDWLVEPSRKFYAAAYDKDAKATLPDCWSNDGVAPEAGASNKQSRACRGCPKDVKGSGLTVVRVRLAAMNAASQSSLLVTHLVICTRLLFRALRCSVTTMATSTAFEGYKKFMLASKHALDTVVTRLVYDTEADTAKVGFKPIRHLTEMEAALVDAAQDDPATEKYTMLTAGAIDTTKAIAAPAPVVAIAAPTVSVNPFGDDDEDEAPATPVKRAAKPKVTPEVKPELASVMGEWLKEEEEEEDDFA
jgi:hypothetical protein